MVTKVFNSLAYARKLKESGVPEAAAEDQAEFIADAFQSSIDNLVTKDYLDARLDGFEARMDSRFTLIFWMMGLGFSVLIIPQLQNWLV
jgi:hypothetical protein